VNTSQGPGSPADQPDRADRAAEDLARVRDLVGQALQGAEANDRPDLIARLRVAQDALSDPGAVHGPERRSETIRSAAGQAVRALNSLETDLRARRSMLADPARVARLRAELEDVQARYDRFGAAAQEWQYALGDGFVSVGSDIDFHLRARVRSVLGDAEAAVNSSEPRKNRDAVEAWLRDRLVIEAAVAYQHLDAGAQQVAARVATQLDLPAPHRLPSAPVLPAERLVAELPHREPAPRGRTPLPAKLLTVMMPAYGGVMMALVLSHYVGVKLPAWVIGTCAVVGALALGGAALSGERGRQLEQRRAEAVTAMRITGDEYQVALSKQVRDGGRVLQQELRRSTADAVTRLGARLSREVELAQAAADAARNAPGELDNIDNDLATLAELRGDAEGLLDQTRAPAPNLTLLPGRVARRDDGTAAGPG
jgi:hypothetical protein